MYRSIQQVEADLARGEARLARMPRCGEAGAEVDALCDGSGALCALSDGIAESDAAARCSRARDICTAARETTAACAREPPP